MNNTWRLCAYYTHNYQCIYSQYLKPSLDKQDIHPTLIQVLASLGNWKANTDYKPEFILDCLDGMWDVVITDVDSVIHSYPTLFDEIPPQYDIAAHTFRWDLHYGRPEDEGKTELLSGTLYLRNNEKVKKLVKKWIELLPKHSWEQQALQEAIKLSPDIKVYDLPREYCYINSCPPRINGGKVAVPIENPVIEHFQASRELK